MFPLILRSGFTHFCSWVSVSSSLGDTSALRLPSFCAISRCVSSVLCTLYFLLPYGQVIALMLFMGRVTGALFRGASRAIFPPAHLFRRVQVGMPILSRRGYILRVQYFPMMYIPSLVVLGVLFVSAQFLLLVLVGMVFLVPSYRPLCVFASCLVPESWTGCSCTPACLDSPRFPMLPSSIVLFFFYGFWLVCLPAARCVFFLAGR